jgi:hypothetical protein
MTPVRVKDAIGALVPAATTTVAGKSRLATPTEATAGLAVDLAVTPAGLAAGLASLKSSLLNGVGSSFDTLKELSDALGGDANFSATVSAQIGTKLEISATSAWARGGLINAADAPTARSYLGLGSAAVQAASAFAAAYHTHAIADISGLQAALDARLSAGSYTASDVLAKLKTIDGNGSGLDADLLRGQTPTTFGLARLIDADDAAARAGLGLGYATVAQMRAGVATGVVADPAGVAAAIAAQSGFVQSKSASYTATTSLKAAIPMDSTAPQITEGTQILSVTITPKLSTSKLRARFQCSAAVSGAGRGIAALFCNGDTNAVDATAAYNVSTGNFCLMMEYEYSPGSTSEQTISVRAGPAQASGLVINTVDVTNTFGGVMRSTLVVEEVA